ncbi:MAG: TRAP transporter substrate-binding protein [Burkholderiales bacterium]|nr:TRAP transporter substrate-binding protein [Burkholderiales bacterium]
MHLRFALHALAGFCAVASAFAATASTQPVELKLSYYVGDQHAMSQWIIRWGEAIEKRTGGRVVIKRFPGAQLGTAQQHYDLARTGRADIAWFFHGGTPGRFPLTELINLPYMVSSAETGTRVLNDPELRAKYLDPEHKGVKVLVLFTHPPGQVHTARKPLATLADLKGLRVRFPSPPTRDFLDALGAAPVGISPTEMVEQLQKGALDGVMIDYGGAGIAFRMGGTIRHTLEMNAYVTSFGLAMNEEAWRRLAPELQQAIADVTAAMLPEIGPAWDGIDAAGRKALVEGGMQVAKLSPADDAAARRAGAAVAEARLAELEAKGLPAREVHRLMQAIAARPARAPGN